MVALRELFPTDPDDRASVEHALRERPATAKFVERLQEYVRGTFDDPIMMLSTRQYDEWDPPLTVFVHAAFPASKFEERYLELVHWMNQDPDYDLDSVAVLLRRRSAEASVQ